MQSLTDSHSCLNKQASQLAPFLSCLTSILPYKYSLLILNKLLTFESLSQGQLLGETKVRQVSLYFHNHRVSSSNSILH